MSWGAHDRLVREIAERENARHARARAAARDMGAPSPLAVAVERRLRKWRRREEGEYMMFGISQIAQGLGTKPEVRGALLELHSRERVKRDDCSNGVYWSAAPLDVIDVRRKRQ